MDNFILLQIKTDFANLIIDVFSTLNRNFF